MKILVVDDSNTDVMLICKMLDDYEMLVAYDGIEALERIRSAPDIDIMILDLNMPRMNGFEVLETIKAHPEWQHISTLILTNYDEVENEIRGLACGAVDYIRKPLNIQSLRKRIEVHGKLISTRRSLENHNLILEKTVEERTREANLARDVTIHAMVGLLEIRNIESSNHAKRTQLIMRALCEHLRTKGQHRCMLTDAYIAELFETSPLHDIGKMGIPDNILLKPAKLTAEEFEIMKKHTDYGVEAIRCSGKESNELSFIRTAAEIIGTHHEKYDGTGYPSGLQGKNIPLSGRLMAIIDVYDALVSARVYKPAYSHETALKIIADERCRHFDPEIVDAFLEIEKDIKSITERYNTTARAEE